jgi:toxin-antitoxin system PIN domain toxin
MSRAVDTNILVYAHREESAHHVAAVELLRRLATGPEPWAIPWPCVYEFLRVVTHPRVFHPPSPVGLAWDAFRTLARSPSVVLLSETERHGEVLGRLLADARPTGNLVHDAHIAALVIEHGVSELLTTDGDFRRFPGLRVVRPF